MVSCRSWRLSNDHWQFFKGWWWLLIMIKDNDTTSHSLPFVGMFHQGCVFAPTTLVFPVPTLAEDALVVQEQSKNDDNSQADDGDDERWLILMIIILKVTVVCCGCWLTLLCSDPFTVSNNQCVLFQPTVRYVHEPTSRNSLQMTKWKHGMALFSTWQHLLCLNGGFPDIFASFHSKAEWTF